MNDGELQALRERVTEARTALEALQRECGGDAGLQEQMAGLYIDVEEARKGLEAAQRASQDKPTGFLDFLYRLVDDRPRPIPETPRIGEARAALAKREEELERVNAFFRKVRALREDLAKRVDLLGECVVRLPGWDGLALRKRFLDLADVPARRGFLEEIGGAAWLELLFAAGRHVEALKQATLQVDAVLRMMESAAETSRAQTPSPLLGGFRSAPAHDAGRSSLRETLGRIQTRTFPDLMAQVARADAALSLLGIRRNAPTAPVAPTEGAPVGMVEADGHRLRYELQGFARAVHGYRTAVEADLKELLDKQTALGRMETPPPTAPGTPAPPGEGVPQPEAPVAPAAAIAATDASSATETPPASPAPPTPAETAPAVPAPPAEPPPAEPAPAPSAAPAAPLPGSELLPPPPPVEPLPPAESPAPPKPTE